MQQEADKSSVNHGFSIFNVQLIILTQPSVAVQPSKTPLDHIYDTFDLYKYYIPKYKIIPLLLMVLMLTPLAW